ncbi:MAG: 1-acyl-sn-glycerol-3-phosphate acyltransferase [Pyrinomonadaceae bacterium]|nr:1-acyl-sn-glycerol-3-phosphate acyltransferase [Pyrinomonadaceae bacterium]
MAKEEESTQSTETVKVLHLWEMIFLGRGSILRQIIHAAISIALRLFFRRIETAGVEKVPNKDGIIFVLNHPNGLIDPALVYVSLSRRVSFLAKSTLFSIPVAGWLLRKLEVLPLYRRIDADGDTSKNLRTFEICRELLNQNRCIAIFPEGISHNETKLQPMKSGAARIALGSLGVGKEVGSKELGVEEGEEEADHRPLITDHSLKIMAVGLFYTSKTTFRSEALIRYGEIFEVEQIELDEDGEPPRKAVKDLTKKIENALQDVTLNLENQNELEAILKAEALFSSVYKNLLFKQTLAQTFQRLQDLAKKYQILSKNDPQKMRELNEKISNYEDELKNSGLTTESLSVMQHPTFYVFRYLVLRIFIITVLSPLAIIGAFIHSPAYLFSNFIGLVFKNHGADAVGATYKVIAAMGLMPLTWLIVGLIIWWFFGWQLALISIPLTILCGYIALRSSETLIDMSIWIKSVWLLFRQRALFLRLLVQRETLQKEIGEIVEK